MSYEPKIGKVVAEINLTGQTANIPGSTLLYAVPTGQTGMYQINAFLSITTPATTSSTLPGNNIAWTKGDTDNAALTGSPTSASASPNTTANYRVGTVVIYAAGGTNITYNTTGYVSTGATAMQYAIHLRVTKLF